MLVLPGHPHPVGELRLQTGEVKQAAGGAGAQLGGQGAGVGMLDPAAVRPEHPEFVQLALLGLGGAGPDPGIVPGHGGALPAVEIPLQLYVQRAGRPDAEAPASLAGVCAQVTV